MADFKCKLGYAPLCLTIVFMLGAIVGMLTVDFFHAPMSRNILVLIVATIAFHISHRQPAWLSKFFK